MKYFMGFVLCLSLIVNFIYMTQYKEYTMIVKDVWHSPSGNDYIDNTYTIKFNSYKEPEFIKGDHRDTTIEGGKVMIRADYMFNMIGDTSDEHSYVVTYKTK